MKLDSDERALMSEVEAALFMADNFPDDWDGEAKLSTIRGRKDWLRLIEPLPCGSGSVHPGFEYNGASVGILRFCFPKWKHPIATGRHDRRVDIANRFRKINRRLSNKLRKFADVAFKYDVRVNGNWWEIHAGYAAVRVGAFL